MYIHIPAGIIEFMPETHLLIHIFVVSPGFLGYLLFGYLGLGFLGSIRVFTYTTHHLEEIV